MTKPLAGLLLAAFLTFCNVIVIFPWKFCVNMLLTVTVLAFASTVHALCP